ncbi:hypothetical protein F2Q68_00016058 [Brassica cretica]|uniref:Uncharacterized protein n=1 Tax=Brassica cretica TaxID=69181 RepID=A0A8S9HID1_BRACR|nr:hypothetical protein F2Q68_00016058 [Brassica cretica]
MLYAEVYEVKNTGDADVSACAEEAKGCPRLCFEEETNHFLCSSRCRALICFGTS